MTFKTSQVLAPISLSTNSSLIHYNSAMMIHYNSAMMDYFLLPECSYSPSGLRCVIKVTSHLMLIVSCVLYLAFYSSLFVINWTFSTTVLSIRLNFTLTIVTVVFQSSKTLS